MKRYEELTPRGKLQRCSKAMDILFRDHNCGTDGTVWEKYNKVLDYKEEYNEYDDEYINDLKKSILYSNKYRGYSNYCPLEEVVQLLR